MSDPVEETPLSKSLASKAIAWVENGHLKTILYVVIGIVVVIVWNKIRDMENQLALAKAETGTLNVKFEKLGEAYTGQGEVIKNSNAALAGAIALQGKQLSDAMVSNGNQVRAMFDSQGRIIAELVKGQTTSGVIPTQNGGFSAANLIQARTDGKPALTEVTLNYDPTNPNPQARLVGNWQNYTETFKTSVVEWEKKNDKSLTGTFRLTREVRRPDSSLVGTEEIPLTNATATFDPKTFSIPDPRRWSILAGPVYNYKDKSIYAGGGVEYRFTQNFSLSTGIAGKDNVFLWGRYSFK